MFFASRDQTDQTDQSATLPECGSWKVLIVDDDDAVHQVTRLTLKRVVLDGKGLEFISAYSGVEARQLFQEHDDIALVLLDIVMETDNAGFEVANFIRHELGNKMTRIILRTGQPGDVPERDVIINYEIDGYKTKSELTSDALFSVILTSIRSYRDLSLIHENNQRLDQIVEATSVIFEQHNVNDFISCLFVKLRQFIPVAIDSHDALYFAIDCYQDSCTYLAGHDAISCQIGGNLLQNLSPDINTIIAEARQSNKSVHRDGHLVLVGRSKQHRSLILYFSHVEPINKTLWHMLEIFSRNFETAYENLLLTLENENHRKNLEVQVENRTAQLLETKNRLFQSERMASIGQLAAGVAHEINNPLGFINSNMSFVSKSFHQLLSIVEQYQKMDVNGLPEQLEQLKVSLKAADIEYMSEEIPEVVSEATEGINRIRHIVSDLHHFASFDEGNAIETDLNHLLEKQIASLVQTLVGDVVIRKQFGQLPSMFLMPESFGRAMLNIITNALEAMEGHGYLDIVTSLDGKEIVIDISDTGKGITKESISHIFDPFYTTKEIGKGTGLGLSLAFGVIRYHDGDVQVQSEVGQGTNVKLRLPVRSLK